ncbi:MAG: DUF4136 domain-containing protein [Wenzhouxiangella sp.]|jgi:hypothetical protein|nr:DUF4136 domain-containing protein [Wenzhouxiangella sp.]
MIRNIVTATLLLVFLSACATGARIDTMQAPGVDLSSYERFAFVDPLGTDRAGYASLISRQLVFSTRRELEELGLTFAENAAEADLLVNFQAHLDERIRTREVPEPYMGPTFYDYRYGFYNPWPAYSTRTEIDQVTEGTLVVDLIDAGKNEMVWEGRARNTVTERTRRNAAELIDETVARMFQSFPR